MNTSGYQLAETLFRAGTAAATTFDREEAIERILEQLARLLGGVLTVESTFGAGSTFTATIPIRFEGRTQY